MIELLGSFFYFHFFSFYNDLFFPILHPVLEFWVDLIILSNDCSCSNFPSLGQNAITTSSQLLKVCPPISLLSLTVRLTRMPSLANLFYQIWFCATCVNKPLLHYSWPDLKLFPLHAFLFLLSNNWERHLAWSRATEMNATVYIFIWRSYFLNLSLEIVSIY